MVKDKGLFVRATEDELKFAENLSNQTGLPKNRLVFEALIMYAKSHGIKVSTKFSSHETVLDIKEKEKLSGDYLGSWQKEEKKIERIRNSGASEEEQEHLIGITRAHYRVSRTEMRNLMGTPTEEDKTYLRKKQLVEKHGYKINDVGKVVRDSPKTRG